MDQIKQEMELARRRLEKWNRISLNSEDLKAREMATYYQGMIDAYQVAIKVIKLERMGKNA